MKELTFNELINEITDLTGLNKAEVEEKVWKEALNPGSNVKKDAIKYDVDFHIYNPKMENLYRQSYGFVFETYVESFRSGKRRVMKLIESRITNYIEQGEREIKILMLGDGIGYDLTRLYNHFKHAEFYYFDVPGSKTYDVAIKRFRKYNVEVNLINNYEDIPHDFFDVIVCLEVLEHLPDPPEAIENIYKFLKVNGIVLITESFDNVGSNFPTHLKSNVKYAGRTQFLFHKYGLVLNYYSKEESLIFRPTEYLKRKRKFKDKLNLYFDRQIVGLFFLNRLKNVFGMVK